MPDFDNRDSFFSFFCTPALDLHSGSYLGGLVGGGENGGRGTRQGEEEQGAIVAARRRRKKRINSHLRCINGA